MRKKGLIGCVVLACLVLLTGLRPTERQVRPWLDVVELEEDVAGGLVVGWRLRNDGTKEVCVQHATVDVEFPPVSGATVTTHVDWDMPICVSPGEEYVMTAFVPGAVMGDPELPTEEAGRTIDRLTRWICY